MVFEVSCYSLLLIARDGENVGETLDQCQQSYNITGEIPGTDTAATIVEASRKVLHCALRLKDRLAFINLSSADIGQPGAAVWLRRRENIVVSQAPVERPVSECTIWVATN